MCVRVYRLAPPPSHAAQPADVQLLRDQLAGLKAKLESAQDPAREMLGSEAQEELARKSHELLRVTAELEKTKEVSHDCHVT